MGTTKFEALPDARNIMVTGGAGFMCVATPQHCGTVVVRGLAN